MTSRQPPGTPPPRPQETFARLDVGNVARDLWCTDCKALSGFSADVIVLHDAGVTVVGAVSGCSICLDTPEVPRG